MRSGGATALSGRSSTQDDQSQLQQATAGVTVSGSMVVNAGLPYQLNLPAVDSNGNTDQTAWQINWGDSDTPQSISTAPASVTHVYTAVGNYSISATATVSDGQGGTYTAMTGGGVLNAGFAPAASRRSTARTGAQPWRSTPTATWRSWPAERWGSTRPPVRRTRLFLPSIPASTPNTWPSSPTARWSSRATSWSRTAVLTVTCMKWPYGATRPPAPGYDVQRRQSGDRQLLQPRR